MITGVDNAYPDGEFGNIIIITVVHYLDVYHHIFFGTIMSLISYNRRGHRNSSGNGK